LASVIFVLPKLRAQTNLSVTFMFGTLSLVYFNKKKFRLTVLKLYMEIFKFSGEITYFQKIIFAY